MSTIIANRVTVNAEGRIVVFDGIDFTAKGYLEIKNAEKVIIKNCRVYDLDKDTAKSKTYWLQIYNDIQTNIEITNCYFGRNTNVYNLFEMTGRLTNNSKISNNYFAIDCCTHNAINIYGMNDKATVYIDNNVWEGYDPGGIRIGVKHEPVCQIRMTDNAVLSGVDQGDWTGLVCIQPYGKQTSTFANMTIYINNLEMPVEQKVYGYSGKNDTPMTDETMPKLYLNGQLITIPIYH